LALDNLLQERLAHALQNLQVALGAEIRAGLPGEFGVPTSDLGADFPERFFLRLGAAI
jgi:hypothetical protein